MAHQILIHNVFQRKTQERIKLQFNAPKIQIIFRNIQLSQPKKTFFKDFWLTCGRKDLLNGHSYEVLLRKVNVVMHLRRPI